MNLILFSPAEAGRPLPRADARAIHLLDVLRRGLDEPFDAGLIDGARGKGRIVALGADALELAFTWGQPPPPLDPLTVVVGLPRPQTARKLLREATALGVGALHFVLTEKGEPNYAQSPLWQTDEWRRHLQAGAEQAFGTRLPEVRFGASLAETLAAPGLPTSRLALDNYEGAGRLASADLTTPLVLALGPERGWSAGDRDLLRQQGFVLVHLGERVLRTETACVAAIAIVKARLGWM